MVAELVDAIADGLAHAKAPKKPIIRVAAVLLNSTVVATIVIAVLASDSFRLCMSRLLLSRRLGTERVKSHAGRTLRAKGAVDVEG